MDDDDSELLPKVVQELKSALMNKNPAAATRIQEYVERLNNTPLKIGVTGESGSGKSSFINAFRGVDVNDGAAAPTGVTEITTEVTEYPHPNYPNVILCDLPGIGTTKFPAKKYLKLVGFERFDFFIIISADRFRENDVKLAKKIQRLGKKFYFVRSKIDTGLKAEKGKTDFSKEKCLDTIRNYCITGLKEQGFKSPQVFLVSNWDLQLYDFPLLQETLEEELPEHKRAALLFAVMDDDHSELLPKVFQELKSALMNNNTAAAARIQEYVERLNNTPLKIGVTGESGSGKSSFINSFRGVDDKEEAAAPIGVTETATEVTEYPHPNYPNVILCDLPGIGTTKFPAKKYLKLVGFQKMDFFIIISADRFTENDVKLAKEIQRLGKKFYFVRSKIDNDLQAEKRRKDFSEEKSLDKIRNYCITCLQKQGFESPQVFLVSNWDLQLYDFSLLQETLEEELPEHKRAALLFASPNINPEIIKKKQKAFKIQIWCLTALSGVVAAVPVPGISVAVDLSLLVGAVTYFVLGFGLDRASLKRLSERSGVPYDDLKAVIKSPLSGAEKITNDLMIQVIAQFSTRLALVAAEEVSRLIPIIGIPISMSLSVITTYKLLKHFLDIIADDAQSVCKRVLIVDQNDDYEIIIIKLYISNSTLFIMKHLSSRSIVFTF